MENNTLIADFMGGELNVNFVPKNAWYFNEPINGHRIHERLLFHSDWNLLMEVVEYIEALKTPITNNPNLIGQFEEYDFQIENKFIVIYAHGEVTKDVYRGKKETKKESVYCACVEFIKWYNKNNSKINRH